MHPFCLLAPFCVTLLYTAWVPCTAASPTVEDSEVIADVEEAWVRVHEHPRLEGNHLTLRHPRHAEHPRHHGEEGDLGHAQWDTHASAVHDQISSLAYQIPPGWAFVLYEHAGHRGNAITLVGDGRVAEVGRLGDFDNQPSSFRWEPVVPAGGAITVPATSQGVPVGILQPGDRLVISYVTGAWGFGGSMGSGVANPDEDPRADLRLELVDPTGAARFIRTGTVDAPLKHTVEHEGLHFFRIRDRSRENNTGEVVYAVDVLGPPDPEEPGVCGCAACGGGGTR